MLVLSLWAQLVTYFGCFRVVDERFLLPIENKVVQHATDHYTEQQAQEKEGKVAA